MLKWMDVVERLFTAGERFAVQGTVQVDDGGRLEWCGAGEGRSSGIILLPGLNSTLVIR